MIETNDKHHQKILNYYDENNLLTQYPSKRPLRYLALQKIAENFDKDCDYNENEVNEIIKNSITFSDYETLRRELYEYQFLDRLKDGSKYWVKN